MKIFIRAHPRNPWLNHSSDPIHLAENSTPSDARRRDRTGSAESKDSPADLPLMSLHLSNWCMAASTHRRDARFEYLSSTYRNSTAGGQNATENSFQTRTESDNSRNKPLKGRTTPHEYFADTFDERMVTIEGSPQRMNFS